MRRWMKFGRAPDGGINYEVGPEDTPLYASMPNKSEMQGILYVVSFGSGRQATTPMWTGFRFLEDRTTELNAPAPDCDAEHFEWDHSYKNFTGLQPLSNYVFLGFPLPTGFGGPPLYSLQLGGPPPSKNG
jgi:hypothetical protein